MRLFAAIMAIFIAGIVANESFASAPTRSIIPAPRPVVTDVVRPERAIFDRSSPGLIRAMRPRPRPGSSVVAKPVFAPVPAGFSVGGVAKSLRPIPRPKRRAVQVASSATETPVKATKRGSVCGVRTIRGEKLKTIRGKLKGCGVSKPVKITAVDGVGLSQASIMDCTTAKALNNWVKKSVKPTVGRLGGGVDSLRVAAHYSCRTRNSKPGAKISEHGKGKAIDISAIKLKNGSLISVLNGWRDPAKGKVLKSLHRSACGPFGTVLGPNADKYHQDHFHFDTARYRGGTYCR